MGWILCRRLQRLFQRGVWCHSAKPNCFDRVYHRIERTQQNQNRMSANVCTNPRTHRHPHAETNVLSDSKSIFRANSFTYRDTNKLANRKPYEHTNTWTYEPTNTWTYISTHRKPNC
mmetsp:Transcript_64931/g.132060  ORF Transcript_64931/g.132060 Transcript_64931/m.132060 type:complete len:117 (+) Transcript_64931:249-599(+)